MNTTLKTICFAAWVTAIVLAHARTAYAASPELRQYDRHNQAQAFHALKRAPLETDTVPTHRYLEAMQHTESMPRYSSTRRAGVLSRRTLRSIGMEEPAQDQWEHLGPNNVGAPARAIVVHPTEPRVMYAAGVVGGIWKTRNGGESWRPVANALAGLAVCSLALDPADPNVVYAGTGEGFYPSDHVRGGGIFKTTDAGRTWLHLPATGGPDFHYVNDLVVSPNDSRLIYAATRTGVWLSGDGGSRWAKVLEPDTPGGALDLVVRGDQNPEHILAACGLERARVYRSTDRGHLGSWRVVLSKPEMGRTSLALAPSDQNVVYAMAASTESTRHRDGFLGVYRSTDGGNTWRPRAENADAHKLNTMLLSSAFQAMCTPQKTFLNQGWYANVIAVDPADPEIVWAGGVDLFRSDDGGANWGVASYWWARPPYVQKLYETHCGVDQHAIVFHPDYDGIDNETMVVGNDGGVWITHNARSGITSGDACYLPTVSSSVAWRSLNRGYAAAAFYHGASFLDGKAFVGGCRDNGTLRGSVDLGPDAWVTLAGGDGGFVAVDPRNPEVIYAEDCGLSIRKSVDGGMRFEPAISGITEAAANFLFVAPFTIDQRNPSVLWTGGSVPWRSVNGAVTWSQAGTRGPSQRPVSAIAISPRDSDHVLMGTADGYIFHTDGAFRADPSTTWTHVRPVAGFVSSIVFSPISDSVVYATCSTFGQPHVLKSADAGHSWIPSDGNGFQALPDVPALSAAIDPHQPSRIYVATDIGIFVSTNAGTSWAVEHGNIDNVATEYLSIDPRSRSLLAFTRGHGVYRIGLDASAPPPGTLARDDYSPDFSQLSPTTPALPTQDDYRPVYAAKDGFVPIATYTASDSPVTILGPRARQTSARREAATVIETRTGQPFTLRTDAQQPHQFIVAEDAVAWHADLHLLHTGADGYARLPGGTFALRFENEWFPIGQQAAGRVCGKDFTLDTATRSGDEILWIFSHQLKSGDTRAIYGKDGQRWTRTHTIRCD